MLFLQKTEALRFLLPNTLLFPAQVFLVLAAHLLRIVDAEQVGFVRCERVGHDVRGFELFFDAEGPGGAGMEKRAVGHPVR